MGEGVIVDVGSGWVAGGPAVIVDDASGVFAVDSGELMPGIVTITVTATTIAVGGAAEVWLTGLTGKLQLTTINQIINMERNIIFLFIFPHFLLTLDQCEY